MHFPPLTIKLLWATVIALLVPLVLPGTVIGMLALWPIALDSTAASQAASMAGYGFMPWQIVTHALLLTRPMDLIFVGFTFAFFGAMLDGSWGPWRYGQFLVACVVASGVVQLALLTAGFQAGLISFAPVMGADGVMFGILFACAYLDPRRVVHLIIPPVEIEMRWLVLLFGGLDLGFGLTSGAGLAAFGFLGGILGAWLHIRYWRGEPPFGPRRRPPPPKKPRHLRSIN